MLMKPAWAVIIGRAAVETNLEVVGLLL